MKYNVFNNKDYKKVNKKPITLKEAKGIVNLYGLLGGYNILNNPFIIQGVYKADRKGFNQFLDDMGWEANGQNYEAFRYAMENDELYCN